MRPSNTDQRVKESGWFYHAPVKRREREPVLVPPTSQIPGLNAEIEEEVKSEVLGPVFKDSDTKYVRLAKQGGRQNLLQFKENPNMRERAPVTYPRPEWFYLEDNAIEDAENAVQNDPYLFRVPEYMAHEEHRPTLDKSTLMRRPPFAFDRLSAHEREGDKLKDKTLKLPETVRPGYGIRSGKPLRIKSEPNPGRTKPSKTAKVSQIEQEKPHLKYLPLPEGDPENPKMKKLLSYAYDKEWQENVNQWQVKQDKLRDKYKSMLTGDMDKDHAVSEYGTTIGKTVPPPHKREKPREKKNTGKEVIEDVLNIESRKGQSSDKDLFKLSKFKNVSSKVDTHNKCAASVRSVPVAVQ